MEDTKQQLSHKRSLRGEVVSLKMKDTAVVKVKRTVTHPKYGKKYIRSKKYPAHIGHVSVSLGDIVTIEETRPLSKTKRWRIIEKK